MVKNDYKRSGNALRQTVKQDSWHLGLELALYEFGLSQNLSYSTLIYTVAH